MKRILLLISIFSVFQLFSQGINKWAVGLNLGAHDGIHYAGKGIAGIGALHHFSVNGRYMHSNRFGWMISSGYDFFKWRNQDNPTKYIRISAEAVFNFTDILHFDDFTTKFGLQSHLGLGYARMWNKQGINTNSGGTPFIENGPFDNMLHGIVGLTPLYKLNEHININMDLSYVFHLRQERTFDFRQDIPSIGGFLGSFYNLSIGATYYIGKNSRHADWIYSKKITDDRILVLKSQFVETKFGLEDDDRDGVINAVDEEPNTTLGAVVDKKGVSDSLFNGQNNLSADDIKKQLQETKNYLNDDDNDGVINGIDEEPNTPEGVIVNNKGKYILSSQNNTSDNQNSSVEKLSIEELRQELILTKNKLNDDDKDGIINAIDEEINTPLNSTVDNKGRTIQITELSTTKTNSNEISNDELIKLLNETQKKLMDDDKDGVINAVDEEPQTNPGAIVNSKGIEIIKNANVIENELAIYDVFFEIGSSTIDVNYKTLLDKLAKLLIAEPKLIINATGFADKNGSTKVNNKLSKDRVTNCVNYLASKGISKSRFIISNKVVSEQINTNSNIDLNAINRRVSFSVEK